MLQCMVVCEVSEVESRSALIQLTPPTVNSAELDVEASEFQYELSLSDQRDGAYTVMYRCDMSHATGHYTVMHRCDMSHATGHYTVMYRCDMSHATGHYTVMYRCDMSHLSLIHI